MTDLPPSWWAWFRGEKPLPDNHVDTSWLDRVTPFVAEPTFTPSDAQSRLAEVEQLLADHARSEGRAPTGSVRQQVEALLDRLHEQNQDI